MTVTRSLRFTVPADTFAEIEHLAKITGTSVATTARMILGFGLVVADAVTEPADGKGGPRGVERWR
jgi:hypothetical protein